MRGSPAGRSRSWRHGLSKASLHQVGDGLGMNLAAELLAHHRKGHLARTKALEARGARQILESLHRRGWSRARRAPSPPDVAPGHWSKLEKPACPPSILKNVIWCERRDSNSHGLPHWLLRPARLPVPPLSPWGPAHCRPPWPAANYSVPRRMPRLGDRPGGAASTEVSRRTRVRLFFRTCRLPAPPPDRRQDIQGCTPMTKECPA